MVELNAKQELLWQAVVGIVHCCGKVGPLQLQNTGLFHKDSQRKYQAKSRVLSEIMPCGHNEFQSKK
ncbi:hypothetical protein Peur_006812 [Populus x canadensis]